jgi:hypothetical protein
MAGFDLPGRDLLAPIPFLTDRSNIAVSSKADSAAVAPRNSAGSSLYRGIT